MDVKGLCQKIDKKRGCCQNYGKNIGNKVAKTLSKIIRIYEIGEISIWDYSNDIYDIHNK